MAFSEFELKKCERAARRFVESRRPPVHLRDRLDLAFRVQGQSVEIFEIRPAWNDPGAKSEAPVAKATYVKTQDAWKLFWQRADLKWHRYDPAPQVATLDEVFAIVGRDEYCCFFG